MKPAQQSILHCPTHDTLGQHDHSFGQSIYRQTERRTLQAALLTLAVMVLEIAAGWWSGSMALLGDGVHMGGHALALGLATTAYTMARRYARDRRLSLGSGKVTDLAAYTSAGFLGASALWLFVESIQRLLHPGELLALEAMAVAGAGLVVNLFCAWLLSEGHDHDHAHTDEGLHHHDHNLRAALVHVLADAATSIAAILGLLGAWLYGWYWLDPAIALLAAALVGRWAWQLMKQTAAVLLDAEAPEQLRRKVIACLESVSDSQVGDLHLWSIGQGNWTLTATVVSHRQTTPGDYRSALMHLPGLHHPIIEVHCCQSCEPLASL